MWRQSPPETTVTLRTQLVHRAQWWSQHGGQDVDPGLGIQAWLSFARDAVCTPVGPMPTPSAVGGWEGQGPKARGSVGANPGIWYTRGDSPSGNTRQSLIGGVSCKKEQIQHQSHQNHRARAETECFWLGQACQVRWRWVWDGPGLPSELGPELQDARLRPGWGACAAASRSV